MRNEISRSISIRASDSRFRGVGGGELDLSSFFRDKSITGNSIFLGSGRKNIGLEGGGGGGGRIGRHFNEAEFPFPLCIKQNPPRSLR